MLTGLTRGGTQRHAIRADDPERSYCGYLIPLDHSEIEEVTCKVCRQHVDLSTEVTE